MLDLASLGRPNHHRFAFGGAAFEIVASAGTPFRLSRQFERLIARDGVTGVAAAVRCEVSVETALPACERSGLDIARKGDTAFITHPLVRAEVWPVSAASYEARARIASSTRARRDTVRGPDAVIAALAGAIVEQQGGLLMHAAAIEFGGCAVLFVGPSGAGKSTAMELVEGARVLAFDRVSVARDSTGAYTAWALPGGSRVDVLRASRQALPLAAVLRVRRGSLHPQITQASGARALFAIRESTEVGDRSEAGEVLRLSAGAELAAGCVVGEIHTVLGARHRALLHDFLSACSSVYALATEEPAHVER